MKTIKTDVDLYERDMRIPGVRQLVARKGQTVPEETYMRLTGRKAPKQAEQNEQSTAEKQPADDLDGKTFRELVAIAKGSKPAINVKGLNREKLIDKIRAARIG